VDGCERGNKLFRYWLLWTNGATCGLWPALALIVWSLRGEAILATGALGLGLAFLAYVTERAFRYAEKNPIPALLGGAQLLELLKDSSAKDKTIIYDAKPIEGAGHSVIEGKHRA
jgi:hypothetical protein